MSLFPIEPQRIPTAEGLRPSMRSPTLKVRPNVSPNMKQLLRNVWFCFAAARMRTPDVFCTILTSFNGSSTMELEVQGARAPSIHLAWTCSESLDFSMAICRFFVFRSFCV